MVFEYFIVKMFNLGFLDYLGAVYYQIELCLNAKLLVDAWLYNYLSAFSGSFKVTVPYSVDIYYRWFLSVFNFLTISSLSFSLLSIFPSLLKFSPSFNSYICPCVSKQAAVTCFAGVNFILTTLSIYDETIN